MRTEKIIISLATLVATVALSMIVCNYAHANPMTKYEQTAEKVFQVPHRDMTYVWNVDYCKRWTSSGVGGCAGTDGATTIHFDWTYWKGLPSSGRCRLYLHEYYHTLQIWPRLEDGSYDLSWDPHADPVFHDLQRAQICDKPPIVRNYKPRGINITPRRSSKD